MFYRHLHDPICDLSIHGEEAPQSKESQLEADNARLLAAIDEGLTGTDISLAVRTVEEMYADNAALRLKVQELTAKYDDVMSRWYEMRGVETPCAKCGGAGWRNYANTATWHGGIGGQAITAAVCDVCWGSGDVNCKGEDLRKLYARLTTLETLVKAVRGDCGMPRAD